MRPTAGAVFSYIRLPIGAICLIRFDGVKPGVVLSCGPDRFPHC
jgi:hypothetical protein